MQEEAALWLSGSPTDLAAVRWLLDLVEVHQHSQKAVETAKGQRKAGASGLHIAAPLEVVRLGVVGTASAAAGDSLVRSRLERKRQGT